MHRSSNRNVMPDYSAAPQSSHNPAPVKRGPGRPSKLDAKLAEEQRKRDAGLTYGRDHYGVEGWHKPEDMWRRDQTTPDRRDHDSQSARAVAAHEALDTDDAGNTYLPLDVELNVQAEVDALIQRQIAEDVD
jgi:hypothetical protein